MALCISRAITWDGPIRQKKMCYTWHCECGKKSKDGRDTFGPGRAKQRCVRDVKSIDIAPARNPFSSSNVRLDPIGPERSRCRIVAGYGLWPLVESVSGSRSKVCSSPIATPLDRYTAM